MNINIKVKPIKYTADSKGELLSKISRNHNSSWGSAYGSGLTDLFNRHNNVRVYNLHKINAKYHHHATYKSGVRKGQLKPSVKVRDKQWVAYVYDFNIDLLKLTKLEVWQNDRNFTIKAKN